MNKPAKFINLAHAYVRSYFNYYAPFVRILPTDACNLQCAYCWQRNTNDTSLTNEEFSAILAKAKQLHVGLITFLGGEPMIWPELYRAIAQCTRNNILTDITTNGTLLNPRTIENLGLAGLDYLNISVDGVKPSPVSLKTSVFKDGILESLKLARKQYGVHSRINSVIHKNNWDDIVTLIELSKSWNIQLSLGYVIPDVNNKAAHTSDFYFTESDEPRLRTIIEYILNKKKSGYPIIDPDAYFLGIFKYLKLEKFWDCNYPSRYGWLNVTPSGNIRSCTKRMDGLDTKFVDLNPRSIKNLKQQFKKLTVACNPHCYSNCAFDSYYYTHNKLKMLEKIAGRLV